METLTCVHAAREVFLSWTTIPLFSSPLIHSLGESVAVFLDIAVGWVFLLPKTSLRSPRPMRSVAVCLASFLLLGLLAYSAPALAADLSPESSATLSDDMGSLTVSAGAKYISPPAYKGADLIASPWTALKTQDTNISSPDGIPAVAISFAAERKTSLELPGLRDLRLVGEFSYAGGSARSTGFVTPAAIDYIIAVSDDPAYHWVGGLGPVGGSATSRVSIAEDNFDLRFGLEGKGTRWQSDGGGMTVTPVVGAGVYSATQRYKVSTLLSALGSTDTHTLVESIRTTDLGPELRAGLSLGLPGGVSVSAMASAAALVSWADLDASQSLQSTTAWIVTKRSPTRAATRSLNDTFVSGLFGLTLRGDVPVAEKCSLGLEASGRYWTRRPTIENPLSLGGSGVLTGAGTNEGVRIGQDSASEVGAALRLAYTF